VADQLGVAENVHFLGFVPDDDLPRVYTAADVFVMPGVAELQSLATLEAMASGLPIIAADAMALPHLVHPGINGFLYRPGDVDAVSRHGLALLAEPPLRHRMGRASREIARTHDAGRHAGRVRRSLHQSGGTCAGGFHQQHGRLVDPR